MEPELRLSEKIELMGLLFLHGMALAAWFVPLGPVLDAAGLGSMKPFAFGASAIAALLSPLFFGSLADRSVPPTKVLRWISFVTAASVWLIAWGIESKWNPFLLWGLIQFQSLFCTPTSSLAGSIVFSRLINSKRQFGAIRALGTIGWMAGCWVTSLLSLDTTPKAFVLSAGLWVVTALYTWLLPSSVLPEVTGRKMTLRERFGFDALGLLKNPDHRVVFITAGLVAIPFAAFYPYTPRHLEDLGFQRLTAWMSLGQVSEVFAMLAIGGLFGRFRLKWIIALGLVFGVCRYGLYATNSAWPVLVGLSFHGFAFTLTHISSQIYLAERVAPEWRTRAQALLSLMTAGVGNLLGYFLTASWLTYCTTEGSVEWFAYWIGLGGIVMAVLGYFLIGYRGKA
ncbi:MFS transporter [Pirellulaceae bacterium SH449]